MVNGNTQNLATPRPRVAAKTPTPKISLVCRNNTKTLRPRNFSKNIVNASGEAVAVFRSELKAGTKFSGGADRARVLKDVGAEDSKMSTVSILRGYVPPDAQNDTAISQQDDDMLDRWLRTQPDASDSILRQRQDRFKFQPVFAVPTNPPSPTTDCDFVEIDTPTGTSSNFSTEESGPDLTFAYDQSHSEDIDTGCSHELGGRGVQGY